jgi:muramoyltetrapeptide carboxypeptidase
LPYLDQATQLRGVPPKKLLVGYSDSTALHEFMREKWGWATLHAPMPGLREFFEVTKDQMETLRHWIEGSAEGTPPQWKLKFLGRAPHSPIEAELTGGNLSLLASMVGTPYSPHFQNRILFIEDIGEGIYRLDRYFEQLKQSGLLKTTRAIILGTFDLCKDRPPMGLKKRPASARERKTGALGAVRPEVSLLEAQRFIFGEVATQLGIPVAAGLPVGHGPGLNALPLGARYRLDSKGVLKFVSWDAWIARARR